MRSLIRITWLFLLLTLAVLTISSAVKCTEEKSGEYGDELFDSDLLENLDYDSLDESENEAPIKLDYGSPPPSYLSAPIAAPQAYPPPPPHQAYPAPPPPPQAYPAPSHAAYPAPPQPAYSPPASPSYGGGSSANYSAPFYEPTYITLEPASYQQPAYYQPASNNYSHPAPPAYEPASYRHQPAQSYGPPPSPPSYHQQLAYHQPAASNYSYPAPPTYEPPTQSYSPPSSSYAPPAANYSHEHISYQHPAPPAYSAPPTYVQGPRAASYPQPVAHYQAPPPHAAYQKTHNYSSIVQPYRPQPVANHNANKQMAPVSYKPLYLPHLMYKQSPQDMVPMFSQHGYRGNHWTLFYYRGAPSPYFQRQCPKNPYQNGPSQKDIEAAFADAYAQLGAYKQPSYSNMSHPSFASRHQIFSLLSQTNARMDEEGLLLEMVGRYLAERLCLTKWDKQRYLPSLTKFISSSQFPSSHSCSNYHHNQWAGQSKQCYQSKYRTFDGFCNNPYHPYWGKSNVCHIRLLSPDYADGISLPRVAINPKNPLPNPRAISNYIHNDVDIEGPYNLFKMQWGQFINHDISNTALSAYDGLVDCCKQPHLRGCWPIYVPPGDKFYGHINVTCLNFIRSGVCPLCQLGPRQQTNKNTAFLDASTVYGQDHEQANKLRAFQGGQLKISLNRNGEPMLPLSLGQEQCQGICYQAGDSRVNQHPALTALHLLLLRNHNIHAQRLAHRHPQWSDEILFQEARRINIAEYQMITFNEYFPIVFGPILSSYFKLTPLKSGYTYFNWNVDPTTWNEYTTATCRFGHSQISSVFGLYKNLVSHGHQDYGQGSFRLKEWFMRPSLLDEGQLTPLLNGLLSKPSQAVDPWVTNDVRNHLYQSHKEHSGGDLAATNIWRGRDHGIPGYVHYVEYCFNTKVRGWKDLALFIPQNTLNQLRRLYRVVENIDLFTGGMSERHFPGADIGPTFACVNGIQYYHLKFGDRYYFEHGGQAGSFTPPQLDEIRRTSLARLLCRTAYLPQVPQSAFIAPSTYNSVLNCSQIADFNYSAF